VDGLAELGLEGGGDVRGRDGAVEPAVCAGLGAEGDLGLAETAGERLVLGREAALAARLGLAVCLSLLDGGRAGDGRQAARNQEVAGVAVGDFLDIAGLADVLDRRD